MKTILIACSIIACVFCSCQKELTMENGGTSTPPPPPPPPPPVITDTTLLKTFIVLDTTKIAPLDTQFIYRYSYDQLKRCTLITILDYQNAQTGYMVNYFNGNDTLIAREKLFTPGSADSTVEFFTYSAAAQLLSDSLVSYSSTGITTLAYNYAPVNNKVSGTLRSNGQPFFLTNHVFQKDADGKIVSELDSAFLYNAVFNTYDFHATTTNTLTYDSKPCPFYKIYPKKLVVMDFENYASDYVPLYFHFLQPNNVLSHIRTSSPFGPGANHETYQYTYKANGYPATAMYTDVQYGGVLKGIYGY